MLSENNGISGNEGLNRGLHPGKPRPIRELARYEVRPEALAPCVAAIHANCLAPGEFTEYPQIDSRGTLISEQ